MASTLSNLKESMSLRAKSIAALGKDLKVAGARAILTELVNVTPVDTSQALSNWQIGLGSAPRVAIPPYVSGSRGSSRSISAEQAITEGNSELAVAKPEQPVFISNSIHYIGDLNRGTSSQFSGGFIPRALIVFRLAIKDATARLLK